MGNTSSQSRSLTSNEKIRIAHSTLHKNHGNNKLILQNENSLNDFKLQHNKTSTTLNNYPNEELLHVLFKNCNINRSFSSSLLSSSILENYGWDSSTSTLDNSKNFSYFNHNNVNSMNSQSIFTQTVSNENFLPSSPQTSSSEMESEYGEYNNSGEFAAGQITNTFVADEPDDISDTTIRTSRPPSIFPREHDNNSDETATLNPSLLFNSEEFHSLTEVHVISLLQRDDIEINEIEIWNQLISWGIRNTFQLSTKNLSEWREQDFEALKETLRNCITWIRFYQIRPQEFAEYVWPYKKILPQSIIGNYLRKQIMGHDPIMETDMNPPRIPSSDIDSIIMTGRHATILASWMQQEPFCGKNPFNFNLIYRASNDGLSSKIFHENCDDKGPTILVIKLSNSKQIIGAYNPLSYQKSKINIKRRSLIYVNNNNNNNSKRKSNSFDTYLNIKEVKKATFLFSFQTRYYPEETAIISRIIPEFSSEVITKYSNNGLCFGLGPDLRINLDENEKIGKVFPFSFQNPILDFDGNFEFEEIEVFQVLRKTEYREGYYYF